MKKLILSLLILLTISQAAAQTDWLNKPTWHDRPKYAEDFDININPTDLIQEKNWIEECTSFKNTTDGTICESFENVSRVSGNANIYNVTVNQSSNQYLGKGVVRTNLTISTNPLSVKTLKASIGLISDQEYAEWFNQRYYYNKSNITASQVSNLTDKFGDLTASSADTKIKASKLNDFTIESTFPLEASAHVTMVFKFNDFRTGRFTISDLTTIEVESSIG